MCTVVRWLVYDLRSGLSQPYGHRGRANGRGQVRTWTVRVSARSLRSERLNHSAKHGASAALVPQFVSGFLVVIIG